MPLLEELVKLSTGKLGADHVYTLLYTNNLAGQYKAAGKTDQAIKLYRQTLNLQITKLGKNHPDTQSTMNNLAMTYLEAKLFDDAVSLMEETLKLSTNTSGKNHPSTLMIKSNLALCYQSAGKLPQATLLNQETLKARKEVLGEDHPDTLASVINLALCYQEANRMTEAMPLFEQAALGIERKQFLSQDAGTNVQKIAGVYEKNGQLEKAEALRRKWLTVVREQSGIHSSNYADELSGLGVNLIQQRKWNEAEKVLRESLAIREKQDSEKWSTFKVRALTGSALLGQKKFADAEGFILKAYESMKSQESTIMEALKVAIPETLDLLVELYTTWDKKEQAEKYRLERGKYPQKRQ